MKSRMQPKAARGGKALLEGLVRCRHCGRMPHISYSRTKGTVPRYHCKGAHVNHGEDWCISFGGVRVDEAVAQELLRAITGNTIEAAVNAAEKLQKHRGEQRSMLDLEPEQARYEAKLAARRYEAVDPENRLVASDLEARWNGSLQKVEEIEKRLLAFDSDAARPTIPDRDLLMSLAHDLPTVWQSMSNMRLKQRIVHILIKEIVADIDEQRREVVLLIHRAGGQHSQLKVRKRQRDNTTGATASRLSKWFAEWPTRTRMSRLPRP